MRLVSLMKSNIEFEQLCKIELAKRGWTTFVFDTKIIVAHIAGKYDIETFMSWKEMWSWFKRRDELKEMQKIIIEMDIDDEDDE